MRLVPKLVSVTFRTFSFAIGAQKLGHPVPESNFVSELKRHCRSRCNDRALCRECHIGR